MGDQFDQQITTGFIFLFCFICFLLLFINEYLPRIATLILINCYQWGSCFPYETHKRDYGTSSDSAIAENKHIKEEEKTYHFFNCWSNIDFLPFEIERTFWQDFLYIILCGKGYKSKSKYKCDEKFHWQGWIQNLYRSRLRFTISGNHMVDHWAERYLSAKSKVGSSLILSFSFFLNGNNPGLDKKNI